MRILGWPLAFFTTGSNLLPFKFVLRIIFSKYFINWKRLGLNSAEVCLSLVTAAPRVRSPTLAWGRVWLHIHGRVLQFPPLRTTTKRHHILSLLSFLCKQSKISIQSTLVISNSNGLSEIHLIYPYLDTSDLQNWGKKNRTITFHKWIYNLNPQVRDMLKNLWKKGEIALYFCSTMFCYR